MGTQSTRQAGWKVQVCLNHHNSHLQIRLGTRITTIIYRHNAHVILIMSTIYIWQNISKSTWLFLISKYIFLKDSNIYHHRDAIVWHFSHDQGSPWESTAVAAARTCWTNWVDIGSRRGGRSRIFYDINCDRLDISSRRGARSRIFYDIYCDRLGDNQILGGYRLEERGEVVVRFPNPLAFGSGLGERTPKKAIFQLRRPVV